MQSIKQMTDELNQKYSPLSSKLLISVGLVVMLCFFGWLLLMIVSVVAANFFVPVVSSVITMALLFLLYAAFFVLLYGTMVLVTRLERNWRSTLGYIFLGFRSKKIVSSVFLFSGLFLICVIISSFPVLALIDVTQKDALVNFLKDAQQVKLLSVYVLCVFVAAIIVLFYRFAFVWIIIYDSENVRGFKAFDKSWKMLKGHVLQFFAFEFLICWRFIVMMVGINVAKVLVYYVNPKGLESFFGYLFGFMGFATGLLMCTKIALSIPYFYDKLVEFGKEHND